MIFSYFFEGKLVILSNATTYINKAQIGILTDNYAELSVQNIIINNTFVNHQSGHLILEQDASIHGNGKIVNYGKISSDPINSGETVTTLIDISNYGLVTMTTIWDMSGKKYEQYYGMTIFSNLIAKSISQMGGGFDGNGSITTESGYSFSKGTIFPGGRFFGGTKKDMNFLCFRKRYSWIIEY